MEPLNLNIIKDFLDASLKEDVGINGDISTHSLHNKNKKINFIIATRQGGVLSGIDIAKYYLQEYTNAKWRAIKSDGDILKSQDNLIEGEASAAEILLIERVMLNFLQHLSGIASKTHQFVELVKDYKADIYDTRKTLPGMRLLQKYAVRCGGGRNHRLDLCSSIMLKDNHIALCDGDIIKAVTQARENKPHYSNIEVECDTLRQVQQALSAKADIIMLDNMTKEQIIEAVSIINKQAIIEASGGINLQTVKEVAACGVDVISIGALTHSVAALDIGLDFK